MIGIGPSARMMVATRPVDFRKGPDALAALIGTAYGGDPYSGVIYVFRAKRADRIKLIWWDGTGLCLMAKRMESGSFKWPRSITKGWVSKSSRQGASSTSISRMKKFGAVAATFAETSVVIGLWQLWNESSTSCVWA